MKYTHAALGGTFDHLHLGHEYFLTFALNQAEKLSIGVATFALLEKKQFVNALEHFTYRKNEVEKFLESKNALHRVSFFKLHDIFGTTLTDKTLDAIIVTEETKANAEKINRERKIKGLSELTIVVCPLFLGPDSEIITSTNIRSGSTNRNGLPYSSLFDVDILYLPTELRTTLREPLAEPILKKTDIQTAQAVISLLKNPYTLSIGVGDIVNMSLMKAGYSPDIHIIDFKTRRHLLQNERKKAGKKCKNEPGTLYKEAITEIHRAIQRFLKTKKPQKVVIDGEEDLLTLPAILFSPLGTIVLYGQFDKGIVVVHVTEEMKEKVANLVNKFSATPL